MNPPVRHRHMPGELGIWMLVGGDLVVFSLFFGCFLYYRGFKTASYAAAQESLAQAIGIINTLLLLTSSWFVARAVRYLRQGARAKAKEFVTFAGLCGVAFLCDKAIEWHALISAGHTLMAQEFFMFFFMFTGIHALHVTAGLGVLMYLRRRLSGPQGDARADLVALECGGAFWHLVDLLWIVLFSLFYLVV